MDWSPGGGRAPGCCISGRWRQRAVLWVGQTAPGGCAELRKNCAAEESSPAGAASHLRYLTNLWDPEHAQSSPGPQGPQWQGWPGRGQCPSERPRLSHTWAGMRGHRSDVDPQAHGPGLSFPPGGRSPGWWQPFWASRSHVTSEWLALLLVLSPQHTLQLSHWH